MFTLKPQTAPANRCRDVLVVGLIALLAGLGTGCSDSVDPIGPQANATVEATAQGGWRLNSNLSNSGMFDKLLEKFAKDDLSEEDGVLHFHAEGDFSPNTRGVLEIQDRRMSFYVPRGAVREKVTLGADVWVTIEDGESQLLMFEFSPHYEFDRALTLAVGLEYAEPLQNANGHYYLWFYDEEANEWLVADRGRVSRMTNRVIFKVNHFSKYAIGRD